MQQFFENIKQALAAKKYGGLATQLLMAPEFRKDEIANRDAAKPSRESAVALLINPFAEELSIIFTKRSSALKVHRGQVSFPGGQMDKTDPDFEFTALREVEEEIGIKRGDIEVLGWLSNLFIPPTNFEVHVLVAYFKRKPVYVINPAEVEEVVEVPLQILLDKKNIKSKVFSSSSSGDERQAPYYDVKGLEIWGATAMILSEFLELVRTEEIFQSSDKE